MFDINEILGEVAQRGILRDNKMSVFFPIVPALRGALIGGSGDFTSINRSLQLYVEDVNLPGVSFKSEEVRRYGVGVAELRPYVPVFNPCSMMFRCDAGAGVWEYMRNWCRCVVNFGQGPGSFAGEQPTGPNPGQFIWQIGYRDSYVCDVVITAFDDAGNPAIEVTLREAWPIFVGDIPMSWSSRGSYVKFTVQFSFVDWFSSGLTAVSSNNIPTAAGT